MINYVRNIPDINQILTEGKCWEKIGEFPITEAKFDEEFPPLFGGNQNQNLEKTDFHENRNNLTSGQAPAAAQTPAQPARLPLPRQPPASPPPVTRLPRLAPAGPPPVPRPLASHPPIRQPPAHSPGSHRPPACPPPPPAGPLPAPRPHSPANQRSPYQTTNQKST
ncbi:hypothetical protein DSO57_1024554 [Entomophthora muscae]|uniref:Uncharacterized protein n=1 Tax=Entomophthora muscae TaxID=34485 RepID=A0ACC2RH61_9FUNG|nr:hypothetical protein DSO57_1024554 [Entomophthora muscae]